MTDLISKGALCNASEKGDIFAVIQDMPTKTGLNALAADIHQNAVDHGWWEGDRNEGETIALCHAELSEALEELRKETPLVYYHDDDTHVKPEGWAVEMIDCMIRIMDTLSAHGIDIDKVMQEKMAYNRTRPYKHGKAF